LGKVTWPRAVTVKVLIVLASSRLMPR
jgi:hypothetical protein